MNKRICIIWLLLLGAVLAPMPTFAQVPVIERSTEITTISGKQYYMHHVNKGETLYSLCRVYKVTEDEIRRLNPEIDTLGLQADMVLAIPVLLDEEQHQGTPVVVTPATDDNNTPQTNPALADLPISDDDEFGEGYIIHTVKDSEKTKRLLKRWKVTEDDFHRLNPSVGSRVFVGQKVLIPVPGVHPKQNDHQENANNEEGEVTPVDAVVVETPTGPFVLPAEKPIECYSSTENASKTYRVALLVPLYLGEIDKLDTSDDNVEKTKNTRAMRFLQFYEGFMMAVDSLTKNEGLRLELTVIDVNENVAGAHAAVAQLQESPVDMIVGPFFSKSFAVVQEYALSNKIMIVNPLSERGGIVVDAPNVVKLKPSATAMVTELVDLIKLRYPKSKVTLLTGNNLKNNELVESLDQALNTAVAPEVQLSNAEMLELIAKESQRRNMGKRLLSTLEVEGQIFSTKALKENPDGVVFFDNPYNHISYGTEGWLSAFTKGLSSARDNVLVAYGDDIVFATTVLNNVNKSAQKYPITLIGLPNWNDFDNLLVENLLNMNAIYVDDHFVDYNDSVVQKFVEDFRVKYESEPGSYAFEGFDVAWYFMNALMQFGPHAMDCLPYYHLPQLHTRYYFNKSRYDDGLENRYWNIYQYDNQAIELKPIMIYPEGDE